MIEGTEVVCARGAIATGPAEGARAGARIFESGGNAMDAVAAACLACAVVEPQAVDLGGYVAAGVVSCGGDRAAQSRRKHVGRLHMITWTTQPTIRPTLVRTPRATLLRRS